MARTDAVAATLTVATTSAGAAQTYYTGSLCAADANAVRLRAQFVVMAGIAHEQAVVQAQHGVDNAFFADLGTPLTLTDLTEKLAEVRGLAGDWVRLKITYSGDAASAKLAALDLKMTPIPIGVRRPPLPNPLPPSPLRETMLRSGFRVGGSTGDGPA